MARVSKTRCQRVLDLARTAGILRPRDLEPHGIARQYLRLLCDRGLLQRIGRGLYALPDEEVTEHHSLAEACKRVPAGVVCLISALGFHELTTQIPHEVWLAIGYRAWRPRVDHPPIRIVRFSGAALETGIEEHNIEGVRVRLYCAAKTVADCFKYRNKIGLDVAIEALRDCRRQRKCSNDDLWHYAKVCRVARIMQPYMEAIG
ncbi:MAG TPA: type IV toxin-antitoxin system AbiEi family antitoxin domain-containing protein [Planctomycetota bacterium]|nr:type IV toxin-antitoxin system AbiEi family antitoxin domain-containing protein [Planctomycetota bacterium]